MSLEGYLKYGDRGPIIGRWPQPKIRAAGYFESGDRVVIDGGIIRKPKYSEYGPKLPDGSRIAGNKRTGEVDISVPGWWWWYHFGEVLVNEPPAVCCNEMDSREQCDDCPRLGSAMTEPREQQELFTDVVNSVVPCWRGSGVAGCSWPACKPDCDGRPGRAR